MRRSAPAPVKAWLWFNISRDEGRLVSEVSSGAVGLASRLS